MKNKRFNRNIFGDLLTQKKARKGLPILVSHAQKGETISLAKLAKAIELDTPKINWTLQWVFSWIHTTLYELERQDDWEYGEIPGITAIAVAAPEKPTTWMDRQTRVDPSTPLSWTDYETNHVLPVFEYPYWDKVMDFLTEFNVNLDEVDFNNFIIQEVQPSLFGSEAVQPSLSFSSEPEEKEEELPEGEHRYFVYAWRWCGDERFAKIGRTRNGLKGVENRMVTTYHPTDDPVLLGVRECADAEESHKTEQYILNRLRRVRPDREWVEIDERFNEMIDKSFIESQAD